MPLVRIDLLEGKSREYRARIGEVVYQALLDALNVPKNDRFQVIKEHATIASNQRTKSDEENLMLVPNLGRRGQ